MLAEQYCYNQIWEITVCGGGAEGCTTHYEINQVCFTIYTDTGPSGGGPTGPQYGGTFPTGGGGSSTPTPPSPTSTQTLTITDLNTANFVDNPIPKINPQLFINCFDDGKTASVFKMTIYVDQPVANHDDQFRLTGFGIGATGQVIHSGDRFLDVGHTFVGFEKLNTDGSIVRQVMGFYPGSTGVLPGLSSKGVIKNDGGHEYDVSYTITVTQVQFNAALNQLVNDYINKNYRLFNSYSAEYNCTDASLKWLSEAGTYLPNASKGAFINTPGDFGQSLRNIPGNIGISGVAPQSAGVCLGIE